ncbi:hypothetical protein COW36_20015 [bacterium (Candidatus Blackallbacteria) CG17_big_fil_post_rev_8_21_14_2_50_48_46]|uniref:Type I restriction modification DNA specificity domain-containing protein n=1 Tax=bacterium (Candidatus Blackallbacteria) CG17_big_fil_post_rev_8_21_14_2_50_48_46 TaxID=2014261 RepID=A0A2M7G053_9BACT|nr:MAG: hypothetical protein COW64_15280 [bacterium (Candidatus Blackallbacteria) CG18_big_fil_WC_8_21_14_2_50_49_26]PIW14946.1 MAG: hypothetical protein COW36_20015 [bacterium (Candidatus Blackallbacteria) CG17_big_fil_post_rev_8_21_14_2_50_48_46]PIW44328.1 MAG: hypothetical protein COW20_24345 [bacterium (Candidatus Blackallbacteria) CG13_big_fil_rev_8_21_14_2_50_49_14]
MPSNWEVTKIKHISAINQKLPFEEIDDNLEVSFLPMKLVEEESNVIHLTETKKYSEVKKGFTPMTDGDVIFAKITPCMENGKIATVHSLKNRIAFGSTEFHVFRCYKSVVNTYLFYYLVQSKTRQDAAQNMTGAVGQRRVPKQYLEELDIPIPPFSEQHRIVAKLEELFSELDKGVESLKTAQQQLKVYRQAVLKWAFEGLLTQFKDKDLKWHSFKLGEVIQSIDGDRGKNYPKKHEFLDAGHCLFLSTKNVREDRFVFEDNIFISKEKDDQLRGGKLHLNDVVITTRGTLGNVALYDERIKFKDVRINSGMLILRVKNQSILNNKYLMKFITSPIFYKQLKEKQSGTAQPQIPANVLKEIIIPVPHSIDEQNLIVSEIESRLSVCDKIEESIEHSLKQAEALRQSILKQAFEGKLVPQDPNDEPASVLLDRIKAEREQNQPAKKTKTSRAKKVMIPL